MIDDILRLVLGLLRQAIAFIQTCFASFRGKRTIDFDTGISATIEHQIAEGGFSYIYLAHDADSPSTKYALKRIICPDEETRIACRAEAKVHRVLGHHENIMPLKGMKFDTSSGGSGNRESLCYMLFPLISGGSLRDAISARRILDDESIINHSNQQSRDGRYFTNEEILNVFIGLLKGVKSLHDAGYAHCDIKLENILLDKSLSDFRDEEMGNGRSSGLGTPILMDFGSARKLVIKLTDRKTVMNLTEEASQNSTISYRAPELFDGGCRHGPNEPDIDGKVDVWSCGCVLYGLMYGTSPFEMEFRQDGSIKIVECTHLRLLSGKIPSPPKSRAAAYGYTKALQDLVDWILTVDRKERPNLDSVLDRAETLLGSNQGVMSSFDGITTRGAIV